MSESINGHSVQLEESTIQIIKEIQGKVEQFKKYDNDHAINVFEINELYEKTSKTKWKLENVDSQYLKRSFVLVYEKKLKELLKEIESIKYIAIQKENQQWEATNDDTVNFEEDFFLIPDNCVVNEENSTSLVSENEVDLSLYKLSFHNLKNERIIKGMDETEYSSLKIDHLTRCEIIFLNILNSVLIQKIENCTIWLAAVESSVLIYHCANCNILTNAKQLRVHDTVNTNFYITTSSFPIIENSSNLTFSRYNLYFDGLSDILDKIGLNRNSDKWKQVLDFNWQNTEKPSPNFIISEEVETVNVTINKKREDVKGSSNVNQYDMENFPSSLKMIE